MRQLLLNEVIQRCLRAGLDCPTLSRVTPIVADALGTMRRPIVDDGVPGVMKRLEDFPIFPVWVESRFITAAGKPLTVGSLFARPKTIIDEFRITRDPGIRAHFNNEGRSDAGESSMIKQSDLESKILEETSLAQIIYGRSVTNPKRPVLFLCAVFLGTDADGVLEYPGECLIVPRAEGEFDDQRLIEVAENGSVLLFDLMSVLAYTKNLSTEERDLPKKRRKQLKVVDSSPFWLKYRTVVWSQTRKVGGKTSTTTNELGRGVARHLVAGHFKTYTEDNPLFGRYTGTVYCPQHTRGDKGKGEIVKTYVAKG